MLIEVYADIACPWCYIGERRLDKALAQRPDLTVERHWRPFQLQPALPATGLPWEPFAATKFGGLSRARTMFERVTQIGAEDGLPFAFDRVATAPNTRDAHRLVLWAATQEREWAMARALFAAYFAAGHDLNDPAQLAAVAATVGLDPAAALALLGGSEYAADVDRSQAQAEQLGIQGVPFYVIDERYALSGAQPVSVFLQALDLVTQAA
jgi:predicted DsbA family dithiol-disulfide isomerase